MRPALQQMAAVTSLFLLVGGLVVGAPALAKPAASEASEAVTERVDLNSASVDELCTLPGIGPKKAEAIIAFREQKPFTRVTQLLRVKGIGLRTLERLRPFISVGPPARPAPAARTKAVTGAATDASGPSAPG